MGGCAALRSRAVVLVVEGIKSEDNKKPSIFMLGFFRADEGTRTPTVLLPLEPESSASANSATSARVISCETVVLARTSIIIAQVLLKVNTFFKVF